MQILFYFLMFLISVPSTQNNNAEELLDKVKKKLDTIEDYEVKINIIVDMKFLRIPSVSAKVYFKKPDMMKIESEDFAVLPREAINFSPAKFLETNYQSIFIKVDTLAGHLTNVIKIIPLDDSSDIVLSTIWLDNDESVIRKIETTTKNSGTFKAILEYDEMLSYGLPSKMIFYFNVSEPQIEEMINMANEANRSNYDNKSENLTGSIIIEYSNYIINKGLDKSFFTNK